MNSTRIRYVEQSNGSLQSMKRFVHPTLGAMYEVHIDPTTLSYQVVETLSETVVGEGRAANLHQVKSKAKANLVSLGITFDSEERNVVSKVQQSVTN